MPPRFKGTGLFAPPFFLAFSERDYPAARRQDFLNRHGLHIEDLVLVKQVHGTEVVIVEEASEIPGSIQADALVTSAAGPVLGVLTADCLPVFFWDRSKKVAGIAHAGWRGLKDGILPRVIEIFRNRFGAQPSGIRILIGPAIRECCYEVGEEFQSYFPRHYKIPSAGSPARVATAQAPKGRVDLIAAAGEQLRNQGILERNIQDSGICTFCQNERFFSARREGTSERILSVIQLRPGPSK